jgi:serine/threonine-protein phosphatase PGAM5
MYDRVDSLDDRVANGMNALGHEQARLLGARLASLPVRPRLLVSSTLTRARETGDDLGVILGMPCGRDSLLEECSPPSLRDSAATAEDRAESAACESTLEAAWTKYVRPSPDADAHDVLVCHGNVIRWFVTRALGADSRRWITMTIGNASLTILAVRPDGSVRLAMYSDVGHIPVGQQTWTGRGPGWGTDRR